MSLLEGLLPWTSELLPVLSVFAPAYLIYTGIGIGVVSLVYRDRPALGVVLAWLIVPPAVWASVSLASGRYVPFLNVFIESSLLALIASLLFLFAKRKGLSDSLESAAMPFLVLLFVVLLFALLFPGIGENL